MHATLKSWERGPGDKAKFYRSDTDERRLRNELKIFYTFVKQHVSAIPRDPIVQLA